MQRTNDRQFVHLSSQQRDMFADVNPGHSRWNRLKLAADLAWSVRFGIERLVVADPAPAEHRYFSPLQVAVHTDW